MKAIWREVDIVLDRSLIERTEEFEAMEGISYIQYNDVSLEKAKRSLNGVDMHGISRVISTKNDIKFTEGDIIAFLDEENIDGTYLELKVERIQIKVDKKHEKTLNFMPQLKQKLSEKVLYLK